MSQGAAQAPTENNREEEEPKQEIVKAEPKAQKPETAAPKPEPVTEKSESEAPKPEPAVQNSSEPVAPEPPVQKAEPVAQTPEPATEKPEPEAPSPQPVTQNTEVVTQNPEHSIEKSAEAEELKTEPVTQGLEPTAPDPENAAADSEPVAQNSEPAVQKPKPVTASSQPVTQNPEPASPEPDPVTQNAEPAAAAVELAPVALKPEPAAPKPKPVVKPKVSLDETISSMKSLQDDVGQISELRSEEKRVVDVFFESFLALMVPLAKTMPVSVDALPVEVGNAEQAYVDPKGNLMLLYPGGQVEIRNLNEKHERELMICVMQDVMPKFKQLTSAHRRKIESRMKFLSSVTQEIQKISKAFAAANED